MHVASPMRTGPLISTCVTFAMAPALDGGGQVVAGECAIAYLAEQIDDHHIALDQFVDHPGVLASDSAFLLTLFLDRVIHVRAEWHIAGRDGASNQHLVRVEDLPIARELVVVAIAPADTPGLFGCDEPHTLQYVVWYERTAMGIALALPLTC
jgi:hypothetical protein